MSGDELPRYTEFMHPVLRALDRLGGSARLNEIDEAVAVDLGLSDSDLSITYEATGAAILPDRMSWARSYMKTAGLLESGGRGVWVLTDQGREAVTWTANEVKLRVSSAARERQQSRTLAKQETVLGLVEPAAVGQEDDGDWRGKLLDTLRELDPSAFERLCQRLLRESGFVEVNVTGKSGDGGIDGTGILQISLVSFHVLFQCKRYAGSVGAGAVRDFRGAMVGRTDKGLLITTGSFTPDAKREATRDGAPPIELIDGVGLCDHLKRLELGVETRMVEEVSVLPGWFERL